MKKILILFTVLCVIAALTYEPVVDFAYAQYQTLVYIAQGGDTLHVKDGGVIDLNGRMDADSITVAVETVTSLVGTDGTFSNDLTVDDDLAADTLKSLIAPRPRAGTDRG